MKNPTVRSTRRLALEVMEARALLATLFVTSGADDGAGTLRAAIETANANGQSNTIVIRNQVDTIALESSLTYTSGSKLTILGADATIEPAAGSEGAFDLLVSSGGGNLNLSKLTLQKGLNGIYAPVPATRTGVVSVQLNQVDLLDNGAFGLWVDDQLGQGGDGADSTASIDLELRNLTVADNGFTVSDLDGVRIDEGGEGGIVARLQRVSITGNGADGLELDERGAGDVTLTALQSSFDDNGPFDPADLDDGVDIDEAGEGDIRVRLTQVTINGNFDEGLDLTEDGAGSIIAFLAHVQANDNNDEGIKLEELADGDIVLSFVKVEASGTNDEEGIVADESGAGNLSAFFANVTANNNAKDGIDLSEADAGDVDLALVKVTTRGNAGDGVKVEEAGAGRLRMVAINLKSQDNAEDGLEVEQETVDLDEGTLLLVHALLSGNGDDLVTDGVIVTEV